MNQGFVDFVELSPNNHGCDQNYSEHLDDWYKQLIHNKSDKKYKKFLNDGQLIDSPWLRRIPCDKHIFKNSDAIKKLPTYVQTLVKMRNDYVDHYGDAEQIAEINLEISKTTEGIKSPADTEKSRITTEQDIQEKINFHEMDRATHDAQINAMKEEFKKERDAHVKTAVTAVKEKCREVIFSKEDTEILSKLKSYTDKKEQYFENKFYSLQQSLIDSSD